MDYERRLQEIIAADLSIIDPSLMLVGREVATPLGSRIDILAIDADGNLIVVELKRGRTPREVVAQTLDYGSWIRNMTSEEIANTFIDYQNRFFGEATPKGINDALQDCDDESRSPRLGPDPFQDWHHAFNLICRLESRWHPKCLRQGEQ